MATPTFTRARQRLRAAHPHDPAHHGAHTAGHPGAVVVHLLQRVITPALGIPGEAVQQGVEQGARQRVPLHHHRQRTVFHKVLRVARVDAVQTVREHPHGLLDAHQPVINHVVGHAAKGIQRDR